jgi:hypothetical protein
VALAAGLTRDIPWDLGDSLRTRGFWRMQTDAALLGGDLGALRNF